MGERMRFETLLVWCKTQTHTTTTTTTTKNKPKRVQVFLRIMRHSDKHLSHPVTQTKVFPWVKVNSRKKFSAVLQGKWFNSQITALPLTGSEHSGHGHLLSGLLSKSIMEDFPGVKAQTQPPWCLHPAMCLFQSLLVTCPVTALVFLTGAWPQLYLVDSK